MKDGQRALQGALMACLAAGALAAQAQAPAAKADGWQVRGGAALVVAPKTLGGKTMRALPVPFIEARHHSGFFASPQDGVGMAWPVASDWQLTAALGVDMRQRRVKDDARLVGWQDVKLAPALLLGAQYRDGPWAASAKLNTRLKREGEAQRTGASTLQLEVAYGAYNSAQLRLQTGYALTLMDSRFAQTFFGVNAAQARSSGLAQHAASAGVMSSAAFVQAQIATGSEWQVFARGEAEVLQGDAGSSPVVRRKLQPSLVLAVTRNF